MLVGGRVVLAPEGRRSVPPQRSVILDAELREHAGCEPIAVPLAGHGKLDYPHRDLGQSCGDSEPRGLPIPRQKIRDLICWVIGQACQHVGEPSLWIDVVELACLDEGIDRGCSVAPGIGTREGPIFSSDGNLAVILPIALS
jgi:hypothetical protein